MNPTLSSRKNPAATTVITPISCANEDGERLSGLLKALCDPMRTCVASYTLIAGGGTTQDDFASRLEPRNERAARHRSLPACFRLFHHRRDSSAERFRRRSGCMYAARL